MSVSVTLPSRELWERLLYSAQLGTPMYDEDEAGDETRAAWTQVDEQVRGDSR